MPNHSFSLNKTLVLFGIVVVAIIAAALVATMPSAGRVEAHERMANKHTPCRTEEVALDEGYGVSRVVMRLTCEDL